MANVMLIVAAAIWGCNFLFQKIAGQYVGPFTFMAARCFIGAVTLVAIIAVAVVLAQVEIKPRKAIDNS